MNQRHKRQLTITIGQRGRYGRHAEQFFRMFRGQDQRQGATGGESDDDDSIGEGRQNPVAAADRIQPIPPGPAFQIPGRRAVSGEPHAHHRVSLFMKAMSEIAEFRRRSQETMHQKNSLFNPLLGQQEIGGAAFRGGLRVVDLAMGFFREMVSIPGLRP